MQKPKKAFFHKLLIFFILIAIIPPLILTFLGYTFSSKILQDAIYDQAYDSVIQINDSINDFLMEYKTVIDIVEQDIPLQEVLSKKVSLDDYYYKINEKIYFLLASKKYKFPIYILDQKGQAVFETSPLPGIYKGQASSSWGVFRKMNESKDVVLYPQKFINNTGNTTVFTLGKRIVNDIGESIGYILIDINRDAIVNIMNTLGSSKVMDLKLIDQFFYTITDANHTEQEGFFWDSPFREEVSNQKQGKIYVEGNKVPKLLVYHTQSQSALTIVATVPLNIVAENNSYLRQKVIFSFLLSLSLAILISFIFAKYMVRPISKLAKSMKKVEEGNLTVRVNLNRNDELGVLENSFNQMVVRLKESMDNTIEQQRQLRIAEIKILQSQINPHFLYNTLDAIKWTAKLNQVTEISDVVTHLGKLLRNSINSDQEFLTVEENLALINHYLKIQELRYSDGFDVEMDIAEGMMDYKIPKLILQPIVENAIVHGFENIEDKGKLRIVGYEKQDDIYFEVHDNGIGMTEEQIATAISKKSDEHIGLYNVDQRLRLYYGEFYGVMIESTYQVGTKITIRIPIKSGLAHEKKALEEN